MAGIEQLEIHSKVRQSLTPSKLSSSIHFAKGPC